MTGIEYRFAALEVRDSGAVIEGVAMRYGSVACIADVFDESVDAGAFRFDDVILNRMHDRADPIARTGGGGLDLTDSTAALALRAMVPEYRADIRDMVSRGILRGFSVEMTVEAEDWPTSTAPHDPRRHASRHRACRPARLWRRDRRDCQEGEGMPDGTPVLSAGGLSALRRWAERNVIVGDGPRAGQPFKIGGAPWGEVLDSMDDPEIEQCTIRGSVQSGKTATLIVAGLGHMAAGRSVLIFEPDDRLKRTLAARIVAWGRLVRR